MAIMLMNSTANDDDNAQVKRQAAQQLAKKEGDGPFKIRVELDGRIIMCDAVRSGNDWKVTMLKDTATRR